MTATEARAAMIRSMSIAARLAAIGIINDRRDEQLGCRRLYAGPVFLGTFSAYEACETFLDAPGDE